MFDELDDEENGIDTLICPPNAETQSAVRDRIVVRNKFMYNNFNEK